MHLRIHFKFGRKNNRNFKIKMEKLKGIKVLRNKRGKAKQLVIDIDKHYDVVEDLMDVLEAESRLKQTGRPATEVFKEIEAGFSKKKKQTK
jgi:hypothetical protein